MSVNLPVNVAIPERWAIKFKDILSDFKTEEELNQAIKSRADIIMLDNMDYKKLREAVKKIRESLGKTCIIEASGGISLGALEEICKTGIDIVSVGALTNSAKAIDFSLDFE